MVILIGGADLVLLVSIVEGAQSSVGKSCNKCSVSRLASFKIIIFSIGSSSGWVLNTSLTSETSIYGHHGFQESLALSGKSRIDLTSKRMCCPVPFPNGEGIASDLKTDSGSLEVPNICAEAIIQGEGGLVGRAGNGGTSFYQGLHSFFHGDPSFSWSIGNGEGKCSHAILAAPPCLFLAPWVF